MTVIVQFVVRTLVLTGLTALLIVLWLSSEETASDPLGLGLLVFAVYFVVSGVWGIVDGARHRFGPALLVWLLVGLTIGALIPFINVVEMGTTSDLGADLAASVPFFTVLILVPAAIGLGIGAVIRAVRS